MPERMQESKQIRESIISIQRTNSPAKSNNEQSQTTGKVKQQAKSNNKQSQTTSKVKQQAKPTTGKVKQPTNKPNKENDHEKYREA